MQIWLSALLAATPVPSSTPDPAETFYSPGTIGFIATFGVTAGAVLLIFDMVRRVRRVRYRAEISAKLEAEAIKATRGSVVKEKLGQELAIAVGGPGAEFDAFIKAEQARWQPVIARAAIKPEGV